MRNTLLSLLIVLAASRAGMASQIERITLAELQAKADLIVLAEVTKVAKDGDRDDVTIAVDSYLKGESPQTIYTFDLITRGVKDFDPALKSGDSGVFFLKRKDQEGQVEKAYWGGVATFQQNHFDLTAAKEVSREPLIVTPTEATFVFPVEAKAEWKWNQQNKAREHREYQWTLRIDRDEPAYAFGFSLFTKKDSRVQSGNLQQLVDWGQSNLWRLDDSGGRIVPGADVRTEVTNRGLQVSISHSDVLKRLLSAHPETTTAEIRVPGQRLKSFQVQVIYKKGAEQQPDRTQKRKSTAIERRRPWALNRETLQGRLAIEDDSKSGPGSNVLLVLEVRNNSNNLADIAFTPVDLKMELLDVNNKPLKRVRPPGLGPAPAPRHATIASGDYVGFSVTRYRYAVSGDPDPGVRLDNGWDYWLLKPGTYHVRGSATVTLQQKTGTDETGPRKITLPLSDVILEIPK